MIEYETILEAEKNPSCKFITDGVFDDDCLHYTGSPMDQEQWCVKCKAYYRVRVTIRIS